MINLKEDNFNFSVPIDIVKSNNENEDEQEWRIGGYASTADEDRQGDEIVQKGLDISDFVNYGFFNLDHRNDVVLGYPDKDKCRIDSHGFYVEGLLLKGVEAARHMWEAAVALKKSKAPRRLGFSVEGKVLKRNELGKIVKAKIYNVALTAVPVNPNATFEALCKSFTNNVDEVDQAEIDKALEAGHGDANGSPIVPESLESAFKTLSYAVGDDEEAKNHMSELRKKLLTKQDITKSEFILYLQLTKGLSYEASRELAETLSK